jgi:sarcosine oxidase subunit beta
LGLEVLVLDEQPSPGGQIYRAIAHIPTEQSELLGTDYQRGAELVNAFHASPADYWPQTTVWSLNARRQIGILALTAFCHKAESLGVVYRTHCRVMGIDRWRDYWRVITAEDTVDAPVLVNCAGAWAGQLCTYLDEPVPLKVGAPMMMVTERLPPFLKPVVGAASRKLSFKQMQNGTVLIGGAHLAEHDMGTETTELDCVKLRESSRTVLALFPRMAHVRIVRAWAGLEAFMPDQIPVIGPSAKVDHVYHAFGFSAHGFQLSPVVGRILSELIVNGSSSLKIDPFSIQRFQPQGMR